ncbi:mercury(II) reductase [Sciscionella marina]|uniref:mercury(II) reductase n=1 Tax=Sciscionella marina TaxID=508770 RepID=UPI000477BF56|nr:mercury(II) reductase [Sciscionella marina]
MMFDLAIVGSGGAAFAAAIAARRENRSVVMIERGTVGGTCVNTGCVPSKALLAAAEARHVALSAERFPGVRASADEVAFTELLSATHDLAAGMRAEKYTDLASEYGWEILAGHAHFVDGPALEVDLAEGGTTRVDAEHYLVATGSTPWAPPIPGITEVGYLSSTTALELERLPKSMLVLGGGYIGLEQAQLFARLGTQVTVIARSQLASAEEPEVSQALEGVFADEGITVHRESRIAALRRQNDGVVATVDSPDGRREVRAEQLLVATGRRPVTAGLGLEHVEVKLGERGEILVDEQLRTSNPRIWAAGDVVGSEQFVYVASAHGGLVVDNAFGDAGRTLDYRTLPRVTFTSPSIAGVGLTEAQAREQGLAVDTRVLDMDAVPRAVVNRDTRGLVKLVAEANTGRLLGAHVLAEGAGDVITIAVYVLANHMTVQQMAQQWTPYLTMGEALKLAAQTFTRDVAKLSCCAA